MSNSRSLRRKLARNDGQVIRLNACCHIELTLSPTELRVAHDHGCPATDPTTPAGLAARIQANQAVTAALQRHGYGPAVTVMIP